MLLLVGLYAVSMIRAVLVHGGVVYSVRLDASAVHPLQVWRGDRKLAEYLLKAHHPWSLQVADVDGDDVDEIAVGLIKPTHNLHFPHTTLFILRFDGKDIVRKWAGSSMGRPLIEFGFSPKVKGKPQTLFTLEKRLDGRVALSAHRWTGFGFEKIGAEKSWRNASALSFAGDRLILRADDRQVRLLWKELL